MVEIDRFQIAVAFVLEREGGLVDDPKDPGGITNHGISLRFLKGVVPYATPVTVQDLSRETAIELYWEHFWETCKCQSLPAVLGFAVFDCAVNQGPRTARKLLQRALGVTADGYFGPVTLAAVHDCEPPAVLTDFLARRAKRYAETANFQRYGRGWFRRLFEVQRATYNRLKIL
ncbi:hypothetical protein LCGC14_0355100 [marine sediment metagenome]|uniref:Uncharacterized protein n=1 Tax=marine sediment metagenome TaxID=412755 RepID=A0A0F9T9Q1_9ZZZZ